MSFLRNTSINTKILFPPFIMMVALGTVLLLTMVGYDKQGFVFSQVQEIAQNRLTLVNKLIVSSEQIQSDVFRISVFRFMKLPNKEILPVYQHLEQELSNLGIIYGQILTKWQLDQKEKQLLEQIKIPLDIFKEDSQQVISVVVENHSFGILLLRSVTVPFNDLRSLLTKLLNHENEKLVSAEAISKQTTDSIRKTIIAITLFTTFITFSFTLLIGTLLISNPIRSLTKVMRQLMEGRLSIEVGNLDGQDEIGSMSRAVEVFRNNAIEKQKTEQALQKSEERFRTIFENAPVLIDAFDNMGRCTLWNKECEKTFGWTLTELNSYDDPLILFYSDSEVRKEFRDTITSKPKKIFREWYPMTKKGSEIVISWANFQLPDGFVINIGYDVTERKRAEEQIKASLKEKETLLQEIHHRVKNNMTVISSLLKLQMTRVKDGKAKVALQDSQNRVQTMSMIHETLYRSDNLSSIDMQTYLSELGRIILQGYTISGKVDLKVEAENILIGVKQASPLGLIVNELITNSLKYAFPDNSKGEITLKLKSNKENEADLTVSDNGIGIPEGFDLQNADSLGLKLVKIIAENQLDGSIDMESKNGTNFIIKFNIET